MEEVEQHRREDKLLQQLSHSVTNLASQWDVDLPGILEEFQNEENDVNFSRAAMFIQQSTSLYAKRVENLYNLLFQFMGTLTSGVSQQKERKEAQGDDPDLEELEEEWEKPLLPLDDIPEAKNLTLIEEEEPIIDLSRSRALSSLEAMTTFRPLAYRRSLGESNPRFSSRLFTSQLHESGALLLHQSDAAVLEQMSSFRASFDQPDHRSDFVDMDDSPEMHQFDEPLDQSDNSLSPNVIMDEDGKVHNMIEVALPSEEKQPSKRFEEVAAAIQNEPSRDVSLMPDPWAQLDPHDDSEPSCHFKKGSQRKPSKIALIPPKDVFGCLLRNMLGLPEKNFHRPGKNGAPLHSQFLPYWKEIKRKEKQQRAIGDKQVDVEGEHDDSDQDVFDHHDEDVNHLVPDHVEDYQFESDDGKNQSADNNYEDSCKIHIEAHRKAFIEFSETSDLETRVSLWRSRIEPVLLAEEQHPIFDINSYEHRIVDETTEMNPEGEMDFVRLVKGKEKWDICRYFLSSLMLANQGNIDILNPQQQGFSFRVLRTEIPEYQEH